MITSMHIENFKCFKEFDIELGPFNVLIGPNDTGKTAFLQAIRLGGALGSVIGSGYAHSDIERRAGFKSGTECVWRNVASASVLVSFGASPSAQEPPEDNKLELILRGGILDQPVTLKTKDGSTLPSGNAKEWYTRNLVSICYFRLDPKALRKPCPLGQRMDEIGEGFPAFLDSINRESRKVFFELESRFYERFPYYRQLTLPDKELPGGGRGLSVSFQTVKGETLGAESVSDGVMFSLAFIAIAHQPRPPQVLLIEEPETGVHHASLKEIVRTLKHLSDDKGVQVILTTHSPYLLDHVEPEEVFVFSKGEDGAVRAKKFSDHPDVETLRKHFKTGELWTGFDEKDIVEGKGKFE